MSTIIGATHSGYDTWMRQTYGGVDYDNTTGGLKVYGKGPLTLSSTGGDTSINSSDSSIDICGANQPGAINIGAVDGASGTSKAINIGNPSADFWLGGKIVRFKGDLSVVRKMTRIPTTGLFTATAAQVLGSRSTFLGNPTQITLPTASSLLSSIKGEVTGDYLVFAVVQTANSCTVIHGDGGTTHGDMAVTNQMGSMFGIQITGIDGSASYELWRMT